MRRIASVFISRTRDRKDGSESDKARKSNNSIRLTTPSMPALITSHESSVASSSSIRTPEDDRSNVSRQSQRGFWKKLTRKASTFRPPKVVAASPADDEESNAEDDDYGIESELPPPTPVVMPMTTRRDHLVSLTRSKLAAPHSHPPLVNPLDVKLPPDFPSSSRRHGSNPTSSGLLSIRLQRTRLLLSLQSPLTLSDNSFLGRPVPQKMEMVPELAPPDSPQAINAQDAAIPPDLRVSSDSIGLQIWIRRPCFEDRLVSYVPEDDEVRAYRVSTSKAIAALEYSEHLDYLAAADLTTPVPPPTPSPIPSNDSTPAPSPVPVPTISSSQSLPLPSPLRQEQTVTTPPAASPVSEPSLVPSPSSASTVTARRGVRFAEGGKDEVPLGYVVRKQEQQAAKAKFLREERERRVLEVERARIAEERRQHDIERAQWEKEKATWEAERRAMEEERRQKKYARDFAASRQRQESSRSGGSSSPGLLAPSGSYSSLRDVDHSHRRRSSRQGSSSAAASSPSPSPGSHNSSPRDSSSRPGSLIIPTPPNGSRPSSVHSSSSSGSRPKDGSRRYSSSGHGRLASDRSSSFPTLSQQAFIPPVPNFPGYLEMPLMPPTPPFMLQQYRRRESQSPGPDRRSSTHSSDQPTRRNESSSPRRTTGHERRPSAEGPVSAHGERGRPHPESRRTSSSLNPATVPMNARGKTRPHPDRRRTALS